MRNFSRCWYYYLKHYAFLSQICLSNFHMLLTGFIYKNVWNMIRTSTFFSYKHSEKWTRKLWRYTLTSQKQTAVLMWESTLIRLPFTKQCKIILFCIVSTFILCLVKLCFRCSCDKSICVWVEYLEWMRE